MLQNVLQFVMDPRFLFVFGIAFFGGFVVLGERPSSRTDKTKPQTPPAEGADESDDT